MTEEDFIFDNVALSDFGYIIVHDGTLDEDGVVSNMDYTTVKAAKSDLSHKVATPYQEPYHVDIQIMKNPCQDGELDLTNDDISEMSRWLCRKDYKWFRWVDEIGQDEIWHEVRITMDKKALGDSIIGLVLHVESNRPYGMTRELKQTWDATVDPHTIYVRTDEEGYIYPDIVITKKSANGDISITNGYENRTTLIKNCTIGETITITGGDTLQIVSSDDTHDLSKDFNYKFPRLCNMYSKYKNEISIDGDCTITLSYRGIRKVGL